MNLSNTFYIHTPRQKNIGQAGNQTRTVTKNILNSSNVAIFSPHLDDAILSMGGLIAYFSSRKTDVKIINIFTAGSPLTSPLTKKLLKQAHCTSADLYFKERCEEDIKAIALLGKDIQIENLGLLDAPWRGNRKASPLYPTTTLGVTIQNERRLQKKIVKLLQSLSIAQEQTTIFAPLGRGEHIDHVLTREACKEAYNNVVFYSDFPYLQSYANEDNFITTNNLFLMQWTGDFYKQKANAILAYKSQLVSSFARGNLQLEYETFYGKK